MDTWLVVLLWILVIGGIVAGLSVWGRKLQNRYNEQQDLINQYKQVVQIFVIDKRKDTLDNLKLPKFVKEQIPKSQKKKKMPVVIAKIGPQIQTLLCDENVYNTLPIKKNIKVEMAGVLIVDIVSGKLPQPEKVGFRQRLVNEAQKLNKKSQELKKAK